VRTVFAELLSKSARALANGIRTWLGFFVARSTGGTEYRKGGLREMDHGSNLPRLPLVLSIVGMRPHEARAQSPLSQPQDIFDVFEEGVPSNVGRPADRGETTNCLVALPKIPGDPALVTIGRSGVRRSNRKSCSDRVCR
jgi:hypothetical protein